MNVVSHCPLRVGTLIWQPRPSASVMTVVCKATFVLRPGECTLAPEQEPPIEADEHWNDDLNRSVRAAEELVPVKPRADVILVGYAYPPGGAPIRSLVARLIVGGIDKSIEVHNDRVVSPSGTVQEGGAFKRQQLTYERAAGGPATSNPVGIRVDARDAYGRRTLPNLVPPGTNVVDMNSFIEPVGFGPIAPMWPSRIDKLGTHAARFPPGAHREWPIPEGIDLTYFNQAPLDQQLAELRENERIVLENLHAEHSRLVTNLPGFKPAVFALRPRAASPQRIAMRADTLCIDTESALVTLVFRGQIPLERRDEPIRIAVLMESPGHDVTLAEAERALALPVRSAGTRTSGSAPPPAHNRADLETTFNATAQFAGLPGEVPAAALPFAAPTNARPPSNMPPALQAAALPFQASSSAQTPAPRPITNDPSHAPPRRPGSTSDFHAIVPPPPPHAPTTPPAWAPTVQPAPVARANDVESPWVASGGADMSPHRETVGMAAAAAVAIAVAQPNLDEASRGGAAAASNAAAGSTSWNVPKHNPVPLARDASLSRGATGAGKALTLLWYDPESVPRIRRHTKWRSVLDALEKKPLDRELDDPALATDPMDAEDKREVFEIIVHGAQTDGRGVEESFVGAIRDDGKFVPPLVLLVGELETPFDELAMLRATISTAVPLITPPDEALKAAVSTAKEFLATPDLAAVPGVCEGLAMRIRDAFHREKKSLPQDHLDTQIERFLLMGRHYQKREVFGDAYLRVLMWVPGESHALVGYLPVTLAKKLPMWKRFRARVIAEVHLAQDQYESQARAMRIVAAGREGSGARLPKG